MKKILKFIAPLLLLLSSCGVSNFNKDTTVILDVTTNVTPTFSANFGDGSYENNVYTHHVNLRKDLYIYLSYEGLATETVFIPAGEMGASTIRKSVVFGNSLSSIVTITADNIDDISAATIETNNKLVDTKYDAKKKKVVKLTFEGRDTDLDITLKLEGYKDTKVHIAKERLVGGLYSMNQTFAKTNETVLTVLNANGAIYEYPSAKKVKDVYSFNGNMNNYILDTEKQYFVAYYDTNNHQRVKLIDRENGLFIEGGNDYSQDSDYLGNFELYFVRNPEEKENKEYLNPYFVNTETNEVVSNIGLYSKYTKNHHYAIIFQTWYQDYYGWFIIPDFASLTLHKEGDKYNSRYSYTLSTLELVQRINVYQEAYNILNPDEKLGEYTYLDYINKPTKYEVRDNNYYVKKYDVDRTKKVFTPIVDEKGNKLFDTSFDFRDLALYNEDIVVNGKEKEINIFFIEDLLTYDEANACYRYPQVMVDTSKSYIRVYNASRGGWVNFQTVYDVTADEFVPTKDDTYFEGEADHTYIVYTWDTSMEIKLTAEDVETGIYVTGTKYDYLLKAPEGYNITLDTYNPLKIFYEDAEGRMHLITNKNPDGNITFNELNLTTESYSLEAKYVSMNQNEFKDNTIDFTPVLNYGFFDNSSMGWETHNQYFSTNYQFKYAETESKGSSINPLIQKTAFDSENPIVLATLNNLDSTSTIELKSNALVYDNQLKAVTLDKNQYRIVIRNYNDGTGRSSIEQCVDRENSYRCQGSNAIIVPKDTSITVDGVTVNLAEIDSLYLEASAVNVWDDLHGEWKYTDLQVHALDSLLKLADATSWIYA